MASGTASAKQRDDLDFAGFAQEFLRRNAGYGDDFRKVMRTVEKGAPTDVLEVMARRWGLCFPLRA